MNIATTTPAEVGTKGDVVIGAREIGEAIGLTRNAVLHLAATGKLPGAFQLAGKVALSQAAYRAGIIDRIEAAKRKAS
jgi:hypothetical protein